MIDIQTKIKPGYFLLKNIHNGINTLNRILIKFIEHKTYKKIKFTDCSECLINGNAKANVICKRFKIITGMSIKNRQNFRENNLGYTNKILF